MNTHKRLGPAILCVAIVLRLIEYLHNKAIWLDEAHLAINILQRDYAGLTQRLDFGQGAPLLFLWMERFAVDVAGPSEYALRFVPCIASILACVLVYLFLRRVTTGSGFLIALAIFALSTPTIRYASEVKSYAVDLAVALVLYLLIFRLKRQPFSWMYAALLAIIGAASVWLAFPATFILSGMTLVLILHAARAREAHRCIAFMFIGATWFASIACNYWIMLRHNTQNAEVRTWWLDRFMPLPPKSLTDANWFIRSFFEIFAEPLGLAASGLGALLFLLGAYALWRENRLRLALLFAPIVVALLASGLQLYPFMGRFLLFAVPLILIGVAEGWRFLAAHTQHRAVLIVAILVLLIQPTVAAVKGIVKPAPDGVRPAFEYLQNAWQEGDALYVYCWAAPSFRYYELKTNTDFPKILGQSLRADWSGYVRELEPLRGKNRVWVVLTNTPKQLVGQEDKFILTHLDSIGQRSEERVFPESSVYRYDLSSAPNHE